MDLSLLFSGVEALTAAACLAIAIPIAGVAWRRAPSGATGPAWTIGAFVVALGLANLADLLSSEADALLLPLLARGSVAVLALATAVACWRLRSAAALAPSRAQWQALVQTLEAEVGRRHGVEVQADATRRHLAFALAGIDAAFLVVDRQGKVIQINERAEGLTGWSRHDALGQDLRRVLEIDDHHHDARPGNPVDAMLDRGTPADAIERVGLRSRTGVLTPVELRTTVTRREDGEATGLALMLRDLSRERRAHAQSRQLAALVASSGDAIIGKTLDGRITSWNGGAQAIFGYDESEAIGRPVQMLIPADRHDEEMRILQTLARGETVPTFDTVRVTRDGRLRDMSITISPIRDDDGRVIGASKIARDVTQQRRIEHALRDSEERLRFTLEAAHIGDWDLDLTTGVMQHSARHDRCFGYTAPQADWSFDKFVRHVHPEDRAEVEQTLHVAVTEARDWRVQCRVTWPDGSVHWISKHGSVQRQDGKATRMLGIVSEITEQRQAEDARLTAQRLEAENRQIHEANRLKSQFLANMSHELRTPLNAIIGFADLLHRGVVTPESPKHHEFLGHIGASGRHLLQLINDVLDLSKVESGKFEFFPEPVALPVLLKEVRDVLQTAIDRKGIVVTTDIDPGLTDLTLDPARLKQVLYNFLSNAIKFTATGGRVRVRALADGSEHFRVEVEDTGIGIAADDLPRLFTEFLQLDAGYSKQHQGTGLGLALTRRLVSAQGGTVGVRSTLGEGSVFHVVLNRVHGLDTRRQAAAVQDMQEREADRVLVIEDDERDQALLVAALAEAGFKVDAASNGPYALRRARETAYAALTLDLKLPDRKGLDLLSDIRSQGPSRTAAVVGVTMPADGGLSATFTIANVLCKPLRSDEVTAALGPFRREAGTRAHVMVIDDEAVALDLMRATLNAIGIEALCFQDGRAAIEEIDRHRPDAIVLDLMMPAFDGFQVLDALQRLPAWRHVPVFIWTSMLLTDEEYATLARSARAILVKGGGAMEAMLASVRRWRQPAVPAAADEEARP